MKKFIKELFLSKDEKRHRLVGNPKYWKVKQQFQIDFLKQQGLKSTDKLLDIGCGTLRGGIPIIQFLEPSNYYGIEVRKEVLEEGRKEASEQGVLSKDPQLIHFTDFDTLDINANFDVMFAFSVLIHMTDHIVEKCMRFVASNLSQNGSFYANVNLDGRQKGAWQGFPVMHKEEEFYKSLADKNSLSLINMGSLEKFGHHTGQPNQDNQTMLCFRKK